MADAKREKIIKVRVSAEEHETLKWRCPKPQLAEWMREQCLNPASFTRLLIERSEGPGWWHRSSRLTSSARMVVE
jgi:hypothetical protein